MLTPYPPGSLAKTVISSQGLILRAAHIQGYAEISCHDTTESASHVAKDEISIKRADEADGLRYVPKPLEVSLRQGKI